MSHRLTFCCCMSCPHRLVSSTLTLLGANGVSFANLTDSLLKREQLLSTLSGCSKPGSSCPTLAMCYPCHCSLLSKVTPGKVADKDWVLQMQQECSGFIDTLDMHAYVMK